MSFEAIRITDLDEAKSHRPDPRKESYNLYFRLSVRPPEEWQRLFETRWNVLPRRFTWRHAWVEGEHLVVHCALEELEEEPYALLPHLKEAISNTNAQYEIFLARRARVQASAPSKDEEQRTRLANLKKRLHFD